MDPDEARRRLEAERDRLLGVRETFADEHLSDESESENVSELSSIDQHQADLGTETFEREKDMSILEQIEAELADVDHALHRLDDGTYGTCEVDGKPISEARLEALPAARFCLEHPAEEERARLEERFAIRSAQDVAEVLGGMKGAIMKAGQMISFVAEGLPPEAQEALATLQAEVPPMAPSLAESVVREELGDDPEKLF